MEYQKKLIKHHEKLLLDPEGVLMPNGIRVPCLTIDGSINFKDNSRECEKIINKIKEWMMKNQ